MKTRRILWVILGLGWWGLLAGAEPVRAAEPVVHALLFYSPTCSHCEQVMSQVLPPLLNRYGAQLHILEVDISGSAGKNLYQAAIRQFKIPYERWGVPTLIVGETVLVGADEIPAQFPGLIESSLLQGGAAWPNLAGLADILPTDQKPAPTVAADSFGARLARDPVGTTLAVIVLITLCVAVGYTLIVFLLVRRRDDDDEVDPPAAWQAWVVPLLALAGAGVACYLAFVEVTNTTAACVAGGGCNTVQQSAYSRLFGVIPVGIMGLAGYVLILAAWGATRWRTPRVANWGALALLGLTLFGALFSIYLTCLELFVIKAACIWCLASAEVMTGLLSLATGPGKKAFSQLMR